jgi:hypothetical protein
MYDGIIGIAPPRRNDFTFPSILAELERKGNLDAPMFSLELNTTTNGTGMLVIGANDKLLDHPDTIKLPIVDDPNGRFSDWWTVSFKSVEILSEDSPPMELPLIIDSIAVFDTSAYQIILPTKIAKAICKLIGVDDNDFPLHTVSCERMNTLPDLDFKFNGN